MLRLPGYFQHPSFALRANQIIALELLWPVPLMVVGVCRLLEPLWIGIALALTLLPWITRWFVFGRLTRPAFVAGPLFLLVISGLMGVWVSYDPNLSWPLFLTLLGSSAFFFAMVNTPTSPWRVSKWLFLITILVAAYFVGQYGYFNYPLEVGSLADLGRITGSFLPALVFFTPHPNAIANFLAGTTLLGWVLARRKHTAWGLALALIAYGLLISGSRGAWLGVAVGGTLWAVWPRPGPGWRLRVTWVGLAVIILSGLMGVWLIQNGWSSPALTSTVDTAATRLNLYRNSLYLWSDYPFTGIGLGDTFALVYSHYQLLLHVPFFTYSHNLFISVALGLGLPGLISLIWLLISFYTFVIQVERAGSDQEYQPLFRAAWLGVTIILAHGLTDAPQFAGSGWTMPMLFGLLGLSVASGWQALVENENCQARQSLPVWPQRITLKTVGLVMALVGIVVIGFWRPLLSAWYVNLGALHQTRAELAPSLDISAQAQETQLAIADFTQALRLHPDQPAAHRRLGLIAFEQENYEAAITYLEQAYRQEPGNQVTLKALGYAYMWTGKLDRAEKFLRQLDNQAELVDELGDWSGWLHSQGQTVGSSYAAQVARRLAAQ